MSTNKRRERETGACSLISVESDHDDRLSKRSTRYKKTIKVVAFE